MDDQVESLSSGYAVGLIILALGLGVLTVRVRYQQKLEERNASGEAEIVVTEDFRRFQGTFMSKYSMVEPCNIMLGVEKYVLRDLD